MHGLSIEVHAVGPDGKLQRLGGSDFPDAFKELSGGNKAELPLEGPLKDARALSDIKVLKYACHCVQVLNSTGHHFTDYRTEDGGIKRALYGRPNLDDVTDEEREQAEIDGATIDLSHDTRFGINVIAEARERFGDAFVAVESGLADAVKQADVIKAETRAVIDPIKERHRVELEALQTSHNQELEAAEAPFKARIDAVVENAEAFETQAQKLFQSLDKTTDGT